MEQLVDNERMNVTNEDLHSILKEVKSDVKELKSSKLDITLHDKDQIIFDLKLNAIVADLQKITFYARWGTLIVAGSILTAVINLVIQSPK